MSETEQKPFLSRWAQRKAGKQTEVDVPQEVAQTEQVEATGETEEEAALSDEELCARYELPDPEHCTDSEQLDGFFDGRQKIRPAALNLCSVQDQAVHSGHIALHLTAQLPLPSHLWPQPVQSAQPLGAHQLLSACLLCAVPTYLEKVFALSRSSCSYPVLRLINGSDDVLDAHHHHAGYQHQYGPCPVCV